jgi:hypothetical protein
VKRKVKMNRKAVVSLIIIVAAILMIFDIKYNGSKILREFEIESIDDSRLNINYPGDIIDTPHAEKRVSDRQIVLGEDIKALCIKNGMGSVNISGEKRDDILLSCRLTVYAEEKEEAELLAEGLDVHTYTAGDRMIIEPEIPEYAERIKAIIVDYDLLVPEDLLLDISNSFGRLTVKNMIEDMSLKNSFDTVEIRNNSGDVELRTTYGAIYAEDISGNLAINSSFTNTDCSRIRGNMNANIAFGVFRARDFTNSLRIRAAYSEIEVEPGDGLIEYELYCETKYGNISTNLPFQLERKDNVRILRGSEGSADIKIDIINECGSIRINK